MSYILPVAPPPSYSWTVRCSAYWCTGGVSTEPCSRRPRWRTARTRHPWRARRPGGQTVNHSLRRAPRKGCRRSERTSAARRRRRIRLTTFNTATDNASVYSQHHKQWVYLVRKSVTNTQISTPLHPKPPCRTLTMIDKHVWRFQSRQPPNAATTPRNHPLDVTKMKRPAPAANYGPLTPPW